MPVPLVRRHWSGRASSPVVATVLMGINCRWIEVEMEGPNSKQPSSVIGGNMVSGGVL